jgi:type VI secretion system secreted protein VgrG
MNAMNTTTQEHATLQIDDEDIEVVEVSGREGLSELFRFDIVCRSDRSDHTLSDWMGAAATLTLQDGFGARRLITGVVSEAASRLSDDGSAEITITLRPSVYPQSLGSDCRVFQDQTVVDIAKAVLQDHHGPVRYELVESYPEHVYIVQYREDDWTFLSRRLEDEGIYYWFDHAKDSALVFYDASVGAPELDGGAEIRFAYEAGMIGKGEIIEELGSHVAAAPQLFTVASFNADRPDEKVTASVGEGLYEIYEAPGGGPETSAACERSATVMREAAIAAAAGVTGQSSSVRLVPGRVVTVTDHPVSRYDGDFLITSVRYQIVQRRRGDDTSAARPYTCWFTAIPRDTSYRAPFDTPRARQAGLQSGAVAGAVGEEIDIDPSGRIRVQLHWDREGKRDDKAGKWMRVAQRGTASSMLLPRIGWNVMTINSEGSVDAPSVLNRVHDAEHPPAYKLPENKTRVVYKTATTPGAGSFNEIHFEDIKGGEVMFMNASRNMSMLTQHVKSVGIGNDMSRTVGNNHDLTVDGGWHALVQNDQTVSIDGNEKLEVSGSRSTNIAGNDTTTIGGNRTIKTEDSWSGSVTGDLKSKVGGSVLDTTVGAITTTSTDDMTITVGGSVQRTSQTAVLEDVGEISQQLVLGSKTEIAGGTRSLDVKTILTETITGSMTCQSGGTYVEGADERSRWESKACFDTSAPEIYLEAKDKIEIRCGGSSLVILPDSVEFRSVAFDLSQSPQLDTITKKINHN